MKKYFFLRGHFWVLMWMFSCAVFAHETTSGSLSEFNRNYWMAGQERGKEETKKELSAGDENFRLTATNGRSYSLVELTDKKYIYLLSYQSKSPLKARQQIMARAKLLSSHLSSLGYVYLIHVGRSDRDQLNNELKGSDLKMLEDPNEAISRSLGFKKTGDYLLYKTVLKNSSPQRWRAGNILSWQDGSNIIAWSSLSFSQKMHSFSDAILNLYYSSLKLSYRLDEEFGGKIVYNQDVAQALHRQCIYCHSHYPEIDYLRTASDFKHWSNMNRFVMRTMRMPPSGVEADARYSLCDVNVKYNQQDLRDRWLIQNWFESGSVFGPESLPHKRGNELHKGKARDDKPDFFWKMDKPHRIAASGTIEYKTIKIAGPTTEDYYVKGFWANSNLNIAHHVNVIVSDKRSAQLEMRKTTSPLVKDIAAIKPDSDFVVENIITTFSRRNGYSMFPQGTAFFIPKGSFVFLDIHYNPSGKEEENLTTLGVLLAKKEERQNLQLLQRMRIKRVPFTIAAGQRDFKVERDITLSEPITLIKTWSHSHYRAVASNIQGELPDGKIVPICNTPYYQFKYEINPNLGKEVYLPAGSKIHSRIWYDNSEMNPANPDASVAVANGFQTDSQEMDFIRFVYVKGRLNYPIQSKEPK